MTAEERIAQLEAELATERAEKAAMRTEMAELRAEVAVLHQQMEHVLAYATELEGRLAKDSHNSSKPPSSDGPGRQSRHQRKMRGKKAGGQAGHEGRTLMQVAIPDEILSHRPGYCAHCQQSLQEDPGQVKERRQVMDLPLLRLRVVEHQVQEVCCAHCQQLTVADFLAGVEAPVQYGPNVRALAVYLHQYQLVPLARTCEVLSDLWDCQLPEGTLMTWVERASTRLKETVEYIADWLSASRLQHGDETGVRIAGKRHWLHVNSTGELTYLAWHPKRGKQALEAIGIWPRFHGRAMHDRWKSCDAYPCAHSICGAHLLRDCTFVAEQEQQAWAVQMYDLLVSMLDATEEWRKRGARAVPVDERDAWVAQYFEVLASSFAAQPLPTAEQVPKHGGRGKQSAAKNLLDDLLRRAEQVLAFLDDLRVPFTNNQAERDLRMVKVQQMIAGTFRSEQAATAFCRIRSYLSTVRKQGHSMLAALAAVFAGKPLPIAWGF